MTHTRPPEPEDALRALAAIEDPDLRDGVANLFDLAQQQVDARAVDVVVLSARRLACLYQLLLENGRDPLEGCTVVTSRFMDGPFADTKHGVLILDDSVVVGTTLFQLYQRVRASVADEITVSCLAVCVDKDQRAEYLLDAVNFTALHSRSRRDVERFSEQVVTSLFQGAVPYFSDFPVTMRWEVPRADLRSYLDSDAWWVADVTAPLIADESQVSYTLVPKNDTVDAFLTRLPPSVGRLVEAFKIRTFVRDLDDGSCVIRLVPITMLAPAHPSDLDAAVKDLGLSPSNWDALSPVGKHRLVQSLLSVLALAVATESGQGKLITDRTAEDLLDEASLGLQFPNDHADLIRSTLAVFRDSPSGSFPAAVVDRTVRPTPSVLLSDANLVEVLWDQRELLAGTGLPTEPSAGELTKIGLIFLHAISSVFGYVSRTLEEKQRREIAACKDVDTYLARFGADPAARVLNHCLTLRELMVALAPEQMTGSLWSRSIVSLGIDAGNDLGIVVPTIAHDRERDIVYRCYRLGETAPLADRPLPEAAFDDVWDAMTRAADHGYPARPQAAVIAARQTTAPPATNGSVEAVRGAVADALPGRAVMRYEGVVVAVGNDATFDATLNVPGTDTEQLARLQTHQLTGTWAHELRPGLGFFWTIFQADRGDDARDRVSRIRVRHPAPLDLSALNRAAAQLADLADRD